MKMELKTLDDELSLYLKEYVAETNPEEKNLLLELILAAKTTYNALTSKLRTALRSGKSNLKNLCQSLLPLTVYRFIIYTILIIFIIIIIIANFHYYYYQLSLYP